MGTVGVRVCVRLYVTVCDRVCASSWCCVRVPAPGRRAVAGCRWTPSSTGKRSWRRLARRLQPHAPPPPWRSPWGSPLLTTPAPPCWLRRHVFFLVCVCFLLPPLRPQVAPPSARGCFFCFCCLLLYKCHLHAPVHVHMHMQPLLPASQLLLLLLVSLFVRLRRPVPVLVLLPLPACAGGGCDCHGKGYCRCK